MAAGQIDCSCKDGEILPDGKLPGDVMVSILSNLPVKSLMKFRAVSKSWCSLISSPRFIKLHLHRQSVIANYLLLPLWDDDKVGLLPHNHNKNTTADNDLLILENSQLSERYSGIIDSCNGLVCVFCRTKGIILWNPATRKYRTVESPNDLPYDDIAYGTLGLCYVDATNDFKILVWNSLRYGRYLFVYSISSDSWEELDYYVAEKKYPKNIRSPTLIHGCMHWLTNTCKCLSSSASVILTYDVTDGGAMSGFRLPGAMFDCCLPDDCGCHSGGGSQETLAIRGCLSVLLFPEWHREEYEIDVWVMEEYGVEGSWVKQFAIRGISPFTTSTLWNDGQIVFICTGESSARLTFYDPCSKSGYYLDFMSFHGYPMRVFNYVESLAAVEAELEVVDPAKELDAKKTELESNEAELNAIKGERDAISAKLETAGPEAVLAYRASDEFKSSLMLLLDHVMKGGYTKGIEEARVQVPNLEVSRLASKQLFRPGVEKLYEKMAWEFCSGVDIVKRYSAQTPASSSSDPPRSAAGRPSVSSFCHLCTYLLFIFLAISFIFLPPRSAGRPSVYSVEAPNTVL